MKTITLISLLLVLAVSMAAVQPATIYLMNGQYVQDPLIDMNKIRLDFERGRTLKPNQVWMINFVDTNWNFPAERQKWSGTTNTIVLRDGRVMYQNVVDYEARGSGRLILENRTYIHVSAVARIYYPFARLPQAYANMQNQNQQQQQEQQCSVYLRKGRAFTAALQSYDSRRRMFVFDNRHTAALSNIQMLRFAEDQPIHTRKRYQIPRNVETMILNNGHLATASFVNFNVRKQQFEFSDHPPILLRDITRMYFRVELPRNKLRRR